MVSVDLVLRQNKARPHPSSAQSILRPSDLMSHFAGGGESSPRGCYISTDVSEMCDCLQLLTCVSLRFGSVPYQESYQRILTCSLNILMDLEIRFWRSKDHISGMLRVQTYIRYIRRHFSNTLFVNTVTSLSAPLTSMSKLLSDVWK